METPTGKYLLSGSSGMLGTAIRRALAARQLPVLELSRSTSAPHPQSTDPAQPAANTAAPPNPSAKDSRAFQFVAVSISGEVPWNPTANPPIAHPELLEGLTAVIHLGGANVAARRWTPDYKREIVSSRVDSTRALATELAALRQPPPVLIVASAAGIYGNRGDELLDDASAPGSGFFADLCRQWEAAAQPAVDAGIRVVHLRTGVVIGPRTGPNPGMLDRILPIFRWGLGGRLGPGTQWMSWISLADFASAVLLLLADPSLQGAFNLTSPNPITNTQFTHALASKLHRPAILPAPASILRAAFGELADEALLSSARVFPSRLTAAGFEFAHPHVGDALAAALAENRRK